MKTNGWLDAITQHRRELADKVPPGFQTRRQIEIETGKSRPWVNDMLCKLSERGEVEIKSFRIPARSGEHVRAVPHYRLKRGK